MAEAVQFALPGENEGSDLRSRGAVLARKAGGTIQFLKLLFPGTNKTHRNRNIQAQDGLVVLINHLATNGIGAGRRVREEQSLLLNLDSAHIHRAIQAADVHGSTAERQLNNAVAAEIALLVENRNTSKRCSETPRSTSDILIQRAKSNNSGVLTRHNRVVDDGHFLNMAVIVGIVTNFPGNQARVGQNNLG